MIVAAGRVETPRFGDPCLSQGGGRGNPASSVVHSGSSGISPDQSFPETKHDARPGLLLAMTMITLALASLAVPAQESPESPKTAEKEKEKEKGRAKEKAKEIRRGEAGRHPSRGPDRRQDRQYTATAGMLPLRDKEGKPRRRSSTSPTRRDDAGNLAERPLMFSFNGGPGSASVWLHLGAARPEAGRHARDATIPPPRSAWSTTASRGSTGPTSSSSTRSGPATAARPSPS